MPLDYRGTTALVTGASSGLGRELSSRLAGRGADLVLVARRADRLEELAAELRTRTRATVTVLPYDLATPRPGAALAAMLRERDITLGTLVNNAGFGSHGALADADSDRVAAEVQVNVASLVDLTRTFLPELVATGRGALVNVASTASYQATPGMAVYGATKAFVRSFTEALWYETRGTGLRTLALSPGPVPTEFFDVLGAEEAKIGQVRSAEQVVRDALRALDRRDAPPGVVPGLGNRLQTLAARLAPTRAIVTLSGRMLSPAH